MTSLGPKIENFRSDKQKPSYLNVIESADADYDLDDDGMEENEESKSTEPISFYIYTGVGSQSVVFKRRYTEIAYAHDDESI